MASRGAFARFFHVTHRPKYQTLLLGDIVERAWYPPTLNDYWKNGFSVHE